MRIRSDRRWPSLVGLFVIFVVIPLTLRMCSGPRVVAKAIARDGTRMCVIQEVDWYVTLGMRRATYRTSFFARKGSGPWKSYPVHIEDKRTTRGDWQVSVGVDRVVLYRENHPAITFQPATWEYVLHNNPGYDLVPYDFEKLPVNPW
jgi:hypothetical protein